MGLLTIFHEIYKIRQKLLTYDTVRCNRRDVACSSASEPESIDLGLQIIHVWWFGAWEICKVLSNKEKLILCVSRSWEQSSNFRCAKLITHWHNCRWLPDSILQAKPVDCSQYHLGHWFGSEELSYQMNRWHC